MRKSTFHLLAVVVPLLFMTSLGNTKEVELWFTPMSSEGPAKAPLLKWTEENFPKLLPQGVTVGDNYEPPFIRMVNKNSLCKAEEVSRTLSKGCSRD
jgi:hypothetical protein